MKNSSKWSRHFDCCTGCGRTDRRHEGRGMCKSCYEKAPIERHEWSRLYAQCVVCGTTEKRHAANGVCANCYRRKGSHRVYAWSRLYEKCVQCGSTEKAHQAHGLCGSCYWGSRETSAPEKELVPCDWDRVRRYEHIGSGYLGFLEPETLRRLGYDG